MVAVSAAEDEVVLRVASLGGLVAPTVYLFPQDCEWDCECSSREDPCEHVTAAVIGLRRAEEEGEQLPQAGRDAGHVVYHLKRRGRALDFSRAILRDGEMIPLLSSLTAIASDRSGAPAVVATEADLGIENLLASHRAGDLRRPMLTRLLRRLVACDDVRLDEQPVSVSNDLVLPLVVVEDRGEGFVVTLQKDPIISEIFANGMALCGDTLRPLGEERVTLREREMLSRGRYFAPDDVGLLVSSILPSLKERVQVEVRTKRLPGSRRIAPRLQFEVRRDGDSLAVRPTVVYGKPVNARVVEGRLVHVTGSVPVRDLAAEERLFATVRHALELTPEREMTLAPAEAIAFTARMRDYDAEIAGTAHEDFFTADPLEPVLQMDADSFDLEFLPRGGARGSGVSGEAALRAWSKGGGLVGLNGGGFARLPHDWLERYGRTISDLLEARDASGTLPTVLLPDLAHLCNELEIPPPLNFERLRAIVGDFEGLPEPELPEGLVAELRPYQLKGVSWLQFLRSAGLGGLLADDMGLGKTLQAMCAVRGRTLVVSPTSVLYGWQQQIAQFRPNVRVSLYHGPNRVLDPDAEITLTTYALLRLDIDTLAAQEWESIVLDEAQAIKNPESQVARAAHRLPGRFKITTTGTPIENRLEELWSQMHFVNPGLLGGRADFRRRYAQPMDAGDPEVAAHLRRRIGPFVLRRMKSEVERDLPARTESVLHCELSERERDIYQAVRAATRKSVVERLRAGGNVIEALEALLRLRQASCHPALLPGQASSDESGPLPSAKTDVLLEALDEAVSEGHKSLVFSQWTSFLDLVEPRLREHQIAFDRLDGSTRDRGGVVERFQAPDGPPVLLLSLRAGGTGLNLTAADHVFLLDPWWNPAVEAQAADRAHRIGQERPVMIYRLVARNTVEERILALQERKRALAEAVLGDAAGAASLNRDDLLELLD